MSLIYLPQIISNARSVKLNLKRGTGTHEQPISSHRMLSAGSDLQPSAERPSMLQNIVPHITKHSQKLSYRVLHSRHDYSEFRQIRHGWTSKRAILIRRGIATLHCYHQIYRKAKHTSIYETLRRCVKAAEHNEHQIRGELKSRD